MESRVQKVTRTASINISVICLRYSMVLSNFKDIIVAAIKAGKNLSITLFAVILDAWLVRIDFVLMYIPQSPEICGMVLVEETLHPFQHFQQ